MILFLLFNKTWTIYQICFYCIYVCYWIFGAWIKKHGLLYDLQLVQLKQHANNHKRIRNQRIPWVLRVYHHARLCVKRTQALIKSLSLCVFPWIQKFLLVFWQRQSFWFHLQLARLFCKHRNNRHHQPKFQIYLSI